MRIHLPALSLLAAGMFAGGGLTACGGSSSSPNTTASTASATTSAPSVAVHTNTTAPRTIVHPAATQGSPGALRGSSARPVTPSSKPATPARPSSVSKPQTAFRNALVSFADCLRQNGVKIPAPDTSGKGPVFATKGLNPNAPQYKAALAKCRGVLASALRQASHGTANRG